MQMVMGGPGNFLEKERSQQQPKMTINNQ